MNDPIKQLPKEIQDKLDVYLKRIKKIKWFKPAKDLKKEQLEKLINILLEAFGVQAKISYPFTFN